MLITVHEPFKATTINHSSLKLCEHLQGCRCYHLNCLLCRLGIMPTYESWYASLEAISAYILCSCRHHYVYSVCNIFWGMLMLSQTLLHSTKACMPHLACQVWHMYTIPSRHYACKSEVEGSNKPMLLLTSLGGQ